MKMFRNVNTPKRIGQLFFMLMASALAVSLASSAMAQTTYGISEIGGANCAVSSINDYTDVAGQCDAVSAAWLNGVETSLGHQ